MNNLKRIRLENKLSQSKLSKLSGVNFRSIQDYEQEKLNINSAKAITIYKLSKTLNCKMEDLLEIVK